MMRLRLAIALLVLLGSGEAKPQGVVADISESVVSITTGFQGTDLLLFGAIEPETDVVVVVEGPSEIATVRRKERVGGIWMNTDEVSFRDVPTFYAVLSNRPLEEFVTEPAQIVYNIGFTGVPLRPLRERDRARPDLKDFREALIRGKMARDLYRARDQSVSIMWGRLFRTDLRIPVNAPTGTYWVRIFLFRNGNVVGAQTSALGVDKVGVTAAVYDLAHRHAFAYGVLAVLIAVMAGWGASLAFRKH
jgi:uncharacterized protein (TIGR02186 family)